MTIFNYILDINYLFTPILGDIVWFMDVCLFPLINNHIFEGIAIISIIFLATGSKAGKILDTTSKVIGIAAGGTYLYDYLS